MPPKTRNSHKSLHSRVQSFKETQLPRSKEVRSWIYDRPSAELMARAGFYFSPTKRFTDRCSCFYCGKTQSGWEGVEDVLEYHLSECNQDCLYSKLLHYTSERNNNPEFTWAKVPIFSDPFSKESKEFRKSTFGKSWAYDSKKGSNPTSDKLVNAGFIYSSLEDNDDSTVCVYCGVSLEGWEPEDDPLEEHRKRATDCYFLSKLSKQKALKRKSSTSIDLIDLDLNSSSNDSSLSIVSEFKRPRRLRALSKKLSSDDFSINEQDEISNDSFDESYGITSNEEELNQQLSLKSSFRSLPKSAPSSQRNKILDSSFDDDLFANKNIKNIDLAKAVDSRPQSKEDQQKEKEHYNETGVELVPKVESGHEEEYEESEILAQSGPESDPDYESENEEQLQPQLEPVKPSSSSSGKTITQVSSKTEVDSPVHSPLKKSPAKILDDITNTPQHIIKPHEQAANSSISLISSPLKSRNSNNEKSQELIDETKVNTMFKLSSPKRSESPFLDGDHQQLNKLNGIDDFMLNDDDNPIEESTDHNIIIPIPNTLRSESGKEEPTKIEEKDEPEEESEVVEEEFKDAKENIWVPTDTNKLFEKLNDLESTNHYLNEIKDLPYELHDDIDGRITFFINQMPENELNMTIEQWIDHIALQGKNHLNETCNEMIKQFDDECKRALDKLKSLPVQD